MPISVIDHSGKLLTLDKYETRLLGAVIIARLGFIHCQYLIDSKQADEPTNDQYTADADNVRIVTNATPKINETPKTSIKIFVLFNQVTPSTYLRRRLVYHRLICLYFVRMSFT
jgi:hypothetical protein